jgi:hypothetical protein
VSNHCEKCGAQLFDPFTRKTRIHDDVNCYGTYEKGFDAGRKAERDGMRCETCKHLQHSTFTNPCCTEDRADIGERCDPKEFGCIFHEGKKEKDEKL